MKCKAKPQYVIRTIEYLLTIWVIVTLNFLLPRLMPGDPFLYLSADEGQDTTSVSAKQRAYCREYYGLDQPILSQYGRYLADIGRGELGDSIYYNTGVATIILKRLPWTLLLVISAIGLSSVAGVVTGGFSAMHRKTPADQALFMLHVVLSSIPAFLIGLVLLFIFAAELRWFPLSGAITPFQPDASLSGTLTDILRHAALPVAALTLARTAHIYLLSRNSVLGVLEKDYMRTAKAKGLKKPRIMINHALRSAFPPVCTRIFMSLGSLIGGAILVETIFAYPGLGRLLRQAVLVHDYPLIQGVFLIVMMLVLSANWIADWFHPKLDPRLAGSGWKGCNP